MATYIIGGVIVILIILALRSYFGKKYGADCGGRCAGCPYSGKCRPKKK